MEEEEEEKVKQRRCAQRVKIHSLRRDSIPSLWRFYWVAQSNWETTFCCSPSQKLFLETLGHGKRVWNCGTWCDIEGYPKETLVWEQPSPTTLLSQKTWSKTSPHHKTLPERNWARHHALIPHLVPNQGPQVTVTILDSFILMNEWMNEWII